MVSRAGARVEPDDAPVSVVADETQTRCAISGEPFEAFWDEEDENWHYRGAVRLTRAVGRVPAGALVLRSSL